MHLVHKRSGPGTAASFNRQVLSRADRKAGRYTKLIDGEFLRATAKDRAEYSKIA